MARFDDLMAVVFHNEGGTANAPADHGGLTQYGVTQATYDGYRIAKGLPQQPVTMITHAEATDLYLSDYFTPAQAECYAPPVDLCVFDTAVNSGVGRAVEMLQRVVGCSVDGSAGAQTIAAVAAMDPTTVAVNYCEARKAFYRALVQANPSQRVFLAGWLNRIKYIQQQAGIPVT
jgi:lysozyme family protein